MAGNAYAAPIHSSMHGTNPQVNGTEQGSTGRLPFSWHPDAQDAFFDVADVQVTVGGYSRHVGFITSDIHLGALAAATVNMAIEAAEQEAELASPTAPAAAAGAAAGALDADEDTDAAAAAAAEAAASTRALAVLAAKVIGTYAGLDDMMSSGCRRPSAARVAAAAEAAVLTRLPPDRSAAAAAAAAAGPGAVAAGGPAAAATAAAATAAAAAGPGQQGDLSDRPPVSNRQATAAAAAAAAAAHQAAVQVADQQKRQGEPQQQPAKKQCRGDLPSSKADVQGVAGSPDFNSPLDEPQDPTVPQAGDATAAAAPAAAAAADGNTALQEPPAPLLLPGAPAAGVTRATSAAGRGSSSGSSSGCERSSSSIFDAQCTLLQLYRSRVQGVGGQLGQQLCVALSGLDELVEDDLRVGHFWVNYERLLTLSALPAVTAAALRDSFQQLVAEVQQPPLEDTAAVQHTAALLEAERDLLQLCRQELFVEVTTGAQGQQQQHQQAPQPQLLRPAKPSQVSRELQPPLQQQEQETELERQLQGLTAAMQKLKGLSSGDVAVRRFWRDYQLLQIVRTPLQFTRLLRNVHNPPAHSAAPSMQ